MVFIASPPGIAFIPWLSKDRENRWLLLFLGIGMVVQFAVFKYLYPYPNFMPPDSYSYLRSAYDNDTINLWSIGYSKFLRLFSVIDYSDDALVWFQYLFLQASILYFLFTVRYLLSPGRWLFRILLFILVFNPLIPHISNFVSSDCLFTTVSLIWFTQLCWILYRPSLRLLVMHAFVLLLAFMVRYNGLYFPAISIILILFSTSTKRQKWIGIGVIVMLIGGFIGRTELAYSQRTGTHQFSAFAGWEMASNALYGYAHSKLDPPGSLPVEFRQLHMTVNRHMDSIQRLPDGMRPDSVVALYYQWDFKSPLRVYMDSIWNEKELTKSFFVHWAQLAPLYSAYGRYLILHHPWPFVQHYLWPNAIRYYVPPTGFMGAYVMANPQVDTIAAIWFKWKNRSVIHTRTHTKLIWVTTLFPIPLAMCNVGFLSCFIACWVMGVFPVSTRISRQILRFMVVIWIANMVFSVFAAPIELRYQLFAMITTVTFLGLLLSYLIDRARME